MIEKINNLISSRTALIDQIIKNLDLKVAKAQDGMLKVIVSDFLDKLDTKDGVILNNEKNKRLLSLLDQTFQTYNKQYGLEVVKAVTDGVQKIVNFNESYFQVFNQPAALAPVTQEARGLVLQWLGLDKTGTVTPNGYLDTLIKDPAIKNEVRNVAVKAMVNRAGYFETKKNLADYIQGKSPEEAGALQKYHRNFTFDMFSQVDRANNQQYADKLGLEYAIYEGGLIKTSRPFCRDRNGLVFTREEIAKFNPPTAKPPGYNPFTDLGGYGCRHHLNWVPYAVAAALRPDLKKDGPPPVKPIKEVEPKPEPVKPAEPAKPAQFFDPIKNVDDFKNRVTNIIQKQTGVIPGTIGASFASLPKEKAIRYGNQLAQLTNDYEPFRGMKKIDKITFKSTSKHYGFVQQYQGGEHIVEVNFGNRTDMGGSRRFKPGDTELRNKSRVDDQNLDISTITHEYAHYITVSGHATTANKSIDKRIVPFWDDINAIRRQYHLEISDLMGPKGDKVELNNISLGRYASTNANEFMAEGFTEYKLSSQPSKYAVLIGNLIDKYFKK